MTKILNKLRVFRVYDEDWSDIYGEEQLKGFVQDHILDFKGEEDELQYRLESYVEPKNMDKAKSLIHELYTDEKRQLTIDEALLLLEPLLFEYDELVVY
ncbi:MAG: hypothetical protein J6S67_06630 [Methanobrevibacter sp.]|nr:hypothetical protein [Methanobrevibacter sp.]